MQYDFDSYLLYEVSPMASYTVKVRIELTVPVDGAVLRDAAEKAFRRFPYFSRTVRVNEEGAFELQPSREPVTVMKEGTPVVLGSPQTHGLLFAITYEGNTVFFNFCHNFCGGCGCMPWIRATLWQYLTDIGYDISPEGILIPGSPILPGETKLPDPLSFPEEKPIGEYHGGDSFVPLEDYMAFYQNPSAAVQFFTPIEIETRSLMKYAREHDGSPNSILASAMYRMCSRVFPDAEQISAGIVCNYRQDVGCPDTYRDLVRILHARYPRHINGWPIDKLSTVTRGAMYLQMEPELSRLYYRQLLAYREEIDRLTGREEKARYALANSPLRAGVRDTCQISYVGKADWGGLSEYVKSAYALTEGHLMLEVITTADRFCIAFQTLAHSEKYLKAFLQVLQEENIPFRAGETLQSHLPQIIL